LPVPGYPAWLSRVTAFRGKMVPVIDLAKLFDLPSSEGGVMQQAIVDFNGATIAVLFDGIGEVLLVSQLTAGEGMSRASKRESHITQYLRGVFQRDQRLISLIDPATLVRLYQQRGQVQAREEIAV
jgi:purine-binding chemotaxis protein CheW